MKNFVSKVSNSNILAPSARRHTQRRVRHNTESSLRYRRSFAPLCSSSYNSYTPPISPQLRFAPLSPKPCPYNPSHPPTKPPAPPRSARPSPDPNTNPNPDPNSQPINLSPNPAQLRFAPLRFAPLRYASLRYATLRYAPLPYAPLHYAPLRYATLRSAPIPPRNSPNPR